MSDVWWFRMGGDFVENPKIIDLSDRAFRLHVSGLCYSTRNLTDGVLSVRAVKVVCALAGAARKHIVELRDAPLWLELDDGGYQINDYNLYNPDAESLKELRDKRREAGRRGGIASGASRRKQNEASASASASANASASAWPDASNHRYLTETEDLNPYRPVGDSRLDHDLEPPVDLAARQAAEALYEAISPQFRDPGTSTVVRAAAQELPAEDIRGVLRELENKRDTIRNEGKWVNGALSRRARKRAANAA